MARSKSEINQIYPEINYLKQKIKKISQKKDELERNFQLVLKKRDNYQKLLDELDPGLMVAELAEIDNKKFDLEQKSELYLDLAKKIEEFSKIESNLPDPDEYYNLGSELKKMKRGSFLRRAFLL